MPPFVLAAIPVLLAALGVLIFVVRPLARILAERLADRDLEQMIATIERAVVVVRPIARSTPTDVEDKVVDSVLAVALDEFISEYHRRPKVSKLRLQNVAKAVVVDKAVAASANPIATANPLTRYSPPIAEARVR